MSMSVSCPLFDTTLRICFTTPRWPSRGRKDERFTEKAMSGHAHIMIIASHTSRKFFDIIVINEGSRQEAKAAKHGHCHRHLIFPFPIENGCAQRRVLRLQKQGRTCEARVARLYPWLWCRTLFFQGERGVVSLGASFRVCKYNGGVDIND